jgi:hypothetical protein
VPGKTGRDRKQLFCYVVDVLGVDLHAVAFDEEQLKMTTAANVLANIERVLQLLGEEPNTTTIGAIPGGRRQRMDHHEHTRCHVHPIPVHVICTGYGAHRPRGLPFVTARYHQ